MVAHSSAKRAKNGVLEGFGCWWRELQVEMTLR
jgi:hypothetical protein